MVDLVKKLDEHFEENRFQGKEKSINRARNRNNINLTLNLLE